MAGVDRGVGILKVMCLSDENFLLDDHRYAQ